MKISCLILAKNEQKNISNCIKSAEFCDEIILIDDYSSDKTVEKAKRHNVEVIKSHLNDNFSRQRNIGLKAAKNDYVLFLDSDEIISDSLKDEITNLKLDKADGYYIRRENVFFDKHLKHGEWGDSKLLRLANKNKGKFKRKVHEYWDISGKIVTLKNPIIHKQDEDVSGLIGKVRKYSTLHSLELEDEGKSINFLKLLIWPPAKFLQNIFFKQGWRDGTEGFILGVIMSFHSFLAWSELWLSKRK